MEYILLWKYGLSPKIFLHPLPYERYRSIQLIVPFTNPSRRLASSSHNSQTACHPNRGNQQRNTIAGPPPPPLLQFSFLLIAHPTHQIWRKPQPLCPPPYHMPACHRHVNRIARKCERRVFCKPVRYVPEPDSRASAVDPKRKDAVHECMTE